MCAVCCIRIGIHTCMHTSSTLRVCFLILGYYHQSNTRLLFVLAPRTWSHRSLPTTPEACAISAPSLYVSVVMIKSFFYLYEMSFILISQVISRVLFPNLAARSPLLLTGPLRHRLRPYARQLCRHGGPRPHVARGTILDHG